jgi:hypothetical protein
MARIHVGHGDIAHFVLERIHLPKRRADEYRAQVRRQGED